MPTASNNIAEFLAIVHALALTPDSHMPVYSDSQTARVWVGKLHCSRDSIKTKAILEIVERAERWLATHSQEVGRVEKWETKNWGENPADFNRK